MASDNSGNLYIVAAPSGGGKTSLVKKLIEMVGEIEVSVSHTTRPMRPGEKEGVDYFFIDEEQFISMVNEGAFIEHAKVFNHWYGTSVVQINKRLQFGIDVVLDIDWQGAEQIRHAYPDAVSVFIIPPSLDALNERLMNRRQDKDHVISERMTKAQDELGHYPEFDYLIVNDDFEKAAMELQSIVIANRLRIEKQVNKQAKLLSFLLSSQ
ncbi:TPA: guanylate kinase [Legionella pneumophila subsp. pneumophila]|uniref:guanylate kinase n=1 Tax=Legionella pneumophila TaxID=446 RepID=UPI0001527793|nr:guanylate kinase [Legionella pneumophila]HAT9245990.1 guanylate kinase [Legionella pneumophila subsp. pneumophila]ABQ55443.1 guanylate kinase [Legionella pneumophila str. Corby]MDW9186093.1 guanylate kinase [Legionella pneumophila]CZI45433.1 Guanylate kinase [Legionella pneumophila]CZI71269.1 Guanylate kinase [Legionella pneumophila]